MADYGDVTEILGQLSGGDPAAFDKLLPMVYEELRTLAHAIMRGERPDHTLQATALTHEVFIKMQGRAQVSWQDRAHFMAVAARAMRRILIDHARTRGRQKRGGGQAKIALDNLPTLASPALGSQTDLLALDEALTKLAEADARKCRVVELLYFGGLTAAETAEVLGVTSRTVERDWRFARAWLLRELSGE